MPKVLPKIVDRWRNLRNGRKRYVGQILLFDGGKNPAVIAEVYGSSLKEMRDRKRAVYRSLKELHETKGSA